MLENHKHNTMTSSVYTPLDPTKSEIRVLVIHPAAEQHSPLVCSLQPISLAHDDPKFEALSYTWGSPGKTCDISLNGKSFRVQENAEAALRRVRRTKESRTMWIDAICINQTDQTEKEGQLVLMRQIYEQAEQVCVWLGEPTMGTTFAVQDLKGWLGGGVTATFRDSVANHYLAHLIAPSTPLRNPTNGYAWQWANQLDVEVNAGDLRELLSRPWWTRVWIVQEAVVAQKLTMMVGEDTFDWEHIERSLKRMRTAGILSRSEGATEVFDVVVNPEVYSAQDETYQMISRLRHLWQHRKAHVSIYQLLYEFRHLQCTDARDRVFGCLGLATAGGQSHGIRPDYGISPSEVFLNAALSITKETRSLRLFHYVREWRDVDVPARPLQVFSLPDQAKYHDVGALVSDGPDTRPRKGWARLPDGWERIPAEETLVFASWTTFKNVVRGKTARYYNHATGTMHDESPLEGKLPLPQSCHAARQRDLPPGWVKTWDSVGRVEVRYDPKAADQPPKPTPGKDLDLPSWVPNWCAPTHKDPTPLIGYPSHLRRYWASGEESLAIIHHDPASSNTTLGVEGLLFDTIAAIATPWHPDLKRPILTRRGVTSLENWEALALDISCFTGPCPYTSLEQGRKTALWRTYIADCCGEIADPGTGSTMIEC